MQQHSGAGMKRGVAELSLLFQISRILDRSPDLKDAVAPVLREISGHMGMLRGTLALVNRETGDIRIEVADGLSLSQMNLGRYKLGEGITGRVAQTGRAEVVPKISAEPQFLNRTGARRTLRGKDISFICVPVKLGNRTIGTLSADRLFADNLDFDEDIRLLTIIASMIAQAVRLRRQMQEEQERLLQENVRLQDELRERFRPSNIVGNSKAMRAVYELIARVSQSDTTVLIHGESGAGKELVAHAIHYNSPRAERPFIKVNCAALPETILESELFGHEKGAFTGALAQRKGRFELASGGTIFLDEIGDFSPHTQVRLLRVLQEREFERVGGTKTIKTDMRVIAATNHNLEALIAEGRFRQDLYYRLNVFSILVPPLRERRGDILLLADHFVEKYGKKAGKKVRRISTTAIDMLLAYHWPGNVRELENCIERAALLSSEGVIQGRHLPPTLQTAEATGTAHKGTLHESLERLERELILDALKSSRGNTAKAARELDITERIMGLRIKKYRIESKRFHV